MSLRILMVSQFYPPVAGGEEQHVRNLSTALVARGHDVTVATIALDRAQERAADGSVEVQRFRMTVQRSSRLFSSARPFAPPSPDPEGAASLRRIVRAVKPDVIHGHNWLARSALPRVVRGARPLVMTLHDYGLVCAKKRFVHRGAPCSGPGPTKCLACASRHYGAIKGVPVTLANWATAPVERGAVAKYIAVSAAVAESNQLERRGVPFCVIPNFVPDELAAMPYRDDGVLDALPPGDFILFAGDVSRDKGVEVLLGAYVRVDKPPPLVLLGRPILPVREVPRNVFLLGEVPAAAVVAAWRRSLFAVVPSIVPDASPTVVLEAMASGRPVVAARSGGIPDLVAHGETGLLVSPGDPVALAEALQQLLAFPDLRERMGAAATRRARDFSASSVVPKIEEVYLEAVGRSGVPRSDGRDGATAMGSAARRGHR